jgi:glycosyltransferase involved in cell wall biosynthesis
LRWDRQCLGVITTKHDNYITDMVQLKAPSGNGSVMLYWLRWWNAEYQKIKEFKPDVVHCLNWDTLLPAVRAKHSIGCKVIYHALDSLGGSYNGKLKLRIPARMIEKLTAKWADEIFVVSEPFLDIFHRGIVIYNIPEDTGVKPKSKEGQFTLFYGGNISNARLIKEVARVTRLYKARFVLAGKEMDKGIIDYAVSQGAEYIGVISHDELIRQTLDASATICLSDMSIPDFRMSMPNKLFEAMMCGKPIVVTDGTPMAKVVDREHCGVVLQNVSELARALSFLKIDGARLGQNGREAYEKQYNWTTESHKLLNVYGRLEWELHNAKY